MKRIKKYLSISLMVLCIFLVGCKSSAVEKSSDNQDSYSYTGFAMGTTISEQIYGKSDLTKDIFSELQSLEDNLISWRVENSEISNLNKSAGSGKRTKLSSSTENYLKKVLQLSKDSDGALDPTIGQIARLWDIGGDNPRVPEQKEIDELLPYVGYKNLDINDDGALIPEGFKIDLGAVGKGIGCDISKEILDKNDVDGAVISVGGSILVYGQKPDKSPWKIAITDPRGEDDSSVLGGLTINKDCYISTSGDYEKYIMKDGVRYHHILDPSTGYPSDSDLISVTIVCDNGLLSDGLSTACFILGLEKSQSLLEKYNAEAVFVDKDKNVYVTDGIKDMFELTNDNYKIVNN